MENGDRVSKFLYIMTGSKIKSIFMIKKIFQSNYRVRRKRAKKCFYQSDRVTTIKDQKEKTLSN